MTWFVLALLVVGNPALQGTQAGPEGNYLIGKPDSPVRIELFSDFQCPGCRTFYLETMIPLMDQYGAGNKVAVIFREFPLPAHPSARAASRYSLASLSLGREQFMKVNKYLYECQAEWSYDGNIERVLERILTPEEMTKLREKLKDTALDKAIDAEVALGDSRKINSTPTFFVTVQGKEQRIVGGLPPAVLNAYIAPNVK
jgi:protein-disulfide isomerase